MVRFLLAGCASPPWSAHPAPTTASDDISEDLLLDLVRRYLNTHEGPGTHDGLLSRMERLLIEEALRRTHGNQTHAAQLLGLTRPTLHAKIQKHKNAGR